LPQTYTIAIGARGADGSSMLMASKYDAAFFNVVGLMGEYGWMQPGADAQVSATNGLVVPYEWHNAGRSIRKPRQVARPR
jgi:hypothetical protein